jgi:hypothetical protein
MTEHTLRIVVGSDLLKEYLDRAYIVGSTALMLGKDDCDEPWIRHIAG